MLACNSEQRDPWRRISCNRVTPLFVKLPKQTTQILLLCCFLDCNQHIYRLLRVLCPLPIRHEDQYLFFCDGFRLILRVLSMCFSRWPKLASSTLLQRAALTSPCVSSASKSWRAGSQRMTQCKIHNPFKFTCAAVHFVAVVLEMSLLWAN